MKLRTQIAVAMFATAALLLMVTVGVGSHLLKGTFDENATATNALLQEAGQHALAAQGELLARYLAQASHRALAQVDLAALSDLLVSTNYSQHKQGIETLEILDLEGRVLADHRNTLDHVLPNSGRVTPTRKRAIREASSGYRWSGQALEAWAPIRNGYKRFGTVRVRLSGEALQVHQKAMQQRHTDLLSRLARHTEAALVWVVLLPLFLTALLSWWLDRALQQRLVPILTGFRQAAQGDLLVQLEPRTDEFAPVAEGFNTMTLGLRKRALAMAQAAAEKQKKEQLEAAYAALEEAHKELRDAQAAMIDLSRQAGRAEIATGVVHNVGNILNSVVVAMATLQEHVERLRAEDLARAVGLMKEHRDELGHYLATDPKGRLIPDFLQQLAESIATQRDRIKGEAAAVQKHVAHIAAVVQEQQGHASSIGVVEERAPADVVADALAMVEPSFDRHGVQVTTKVSELEPTPLDTNRILQILVNLLTNAGHAVRDHNNPGDRRVHVGCTLRAANDDNTDATSKTMLEFRVTDSGPGVPKEDRIQIFRHGYTSKSDGHGFGLHSAALAAQDMGGDLSCVDTTDDDGACFVLTVPLGRSGTHGSA